MLKLCHPILTPEDMQQLRIAQHPEVKVKELDMLFPADGQGKELGQALDELFSQAVTAVEAGATILILTDKNMDEKHAPIPVLLAVLVCITILSVRAKELWQPSSWRPAKRAK